MSDSISRLPEHPSLEQLRKQAKELLRQFRTGDANAAKRFQVYKPQASDPILADAQFVLAREYGFESWPKLAQHIDTVRPSDRLKQWERLAMETHGMSLSPPFYRIDWKENTISAGPLTSNKAWEVIFGVMAELQITGLKAEGQLTDKALERLSHLEHVTRLRFGGTKNVTDNGLKHLANMPQLQELELSEYPGGKITDRGLAVLRQLPELRNFQMTWQRGITDVGVANLASCDQLETVDLLGTFTGDGAIKALRGKSKLRSFKTGQLVTNAGIPLLHDFPIFKTWQDWKPRYNLMSFESEPSHLLIDGPFTANGLACLHGLDGLSGLSFFWHTSNLKGEDLKTLAGLPNLIFLGCQGELCDDRAMQHIAAIPGLRMLMGQGTVATDDGFASLSQSETLEYIWGRECPNLKSRGFAALARMQSLRGIAVSCKYVDDDGLSTLPRFPSLIELMPMDVTDDGFRHVGQCTNLESLIMMYCRDTTDVATEHISSLHRLKKYYAGSTKITDRSLEILSGMSSLEQLTFESCAGITDAGVAFLANLPQLREISIGASPNVTREGMMVFPANVRVDYW